MYLKKIVILIVCMCGITAAEFLSARKRKITVYDERTYKAHPKFNYQGPDTLVATPDHLKDAILIRHGANSMKGYIGIPVQFRSKKEFASRDDVYLGEVKESETSYPHVMLSN